MPFARAERVSDAESSILSVQSAARAALRFPSSACAARARRPGVHHPATRAGTQQFMLRGRSKTVDSYRAAGPNRDKPHFGGA
ncbi:conserved hypothetical protein [Burkholderia vietnamiensis]|nr:hypothetical protein EHZ18_17705 [Burkholderia vietnamiensis]TPQ38894.1 hypothetical protein C2U71_23605 [Burkholderia ubonensis]CAG9192284.1 conserved hypothetical protein [Burkholderia vietnamiensis]CAG9231172.1 conserved hypothetical protein [Burkholderia vietnamiensis]